ncbi:MAG: hypothetical protein GVY21_06075 [Gammaproteobacteria bacterium]|jgi:ubiquinone biosynthesis protein UbiJ|nr:hypothetical protein [Gammaproteobacteria bacterium]
MSERRAAGPEAVLADLLADLVNRSLALDPASRARLENLEGSRVQITAELPFGPRDLTLTVSGGRLRCFARSDDAPHAVVRGRPQDLAAWLLGSSANAARSSAGARGSTGAGQVTIDGDTTVLGELSGVLREFRPDLEQPLSQVLGANAARTALGTAELALASLRSALEGAGRTARAGAAETFVDRRQTDRLLDELDDLRLRVDRLGARVAAEEQRRNAP